MTDTYVKTKNGLCINNNKNDLLLYQEKINHLLKLQSIEDSIILMKIELANVRDELQKLKESK